MANFGVIPATWASRLLGVLRIIAAFLFMAHGSQKLFGFPPTFQMNAGSLPPLMLAAGLLEFVGGALLLLGLFTRPVAFLLSGQMGVAYFMSHAPKGFWPVLNGGELAVLYCFLFLYLAAAGGGAWALDNSRRGKR